MNRGRARAAGKFRTLHIASSVTRALRGDDHPRQRQPRCRIEHYMVKTPRQRGAPGRRRDTLRAGLRPVLAPGAPRSTTARKNRGRVEQAHTATFGV